MTTLTPEQIAIIKPVLDELEYDFFDMAGRLDEKNYTGEFVVEAYKAAFSIHREHKLPQYPVYKYIRQHWLTLNDFDVTEEYNIMNQAVILGMNLIKETILKK